MGQDFAGVELVTAYSSVRSCFLKNRDTWCGALVI